MKLITMKSILLIGALFLSGCASMEYRERAARLRLVPVETLSPESVVIITASVSPADGGVYVSGTVSRKFGYDPFGGHVHVIVVSADGEKMVEKATGFNPRSIPHSQRGKKGRSKFIVKIDEPLNENESVRVIAHSGYWETCQKTT